MRSHTACLLLLLLAVPAALAAPEEDPRAALDDDPAGEGVVIREKKDRDAVMEQADGTRVVRTGKACVSIPRHVQPWQANPFGANVAVPTNCPK